MSRRAPLPILPCLILLWGILLAAPALAQQEYTGVTPTGATWRIAVPPGWQAGGPLVLFQHGFNFSPPAGPPSLGELRETMLADGFAVAASSYSQRGWAVFDAMQDNRDLVEIFTRTVGAPGEVLPFGGSLGGLLALKLAEAPGFPPVRAVYSVCPAAAGARLWDRAIDLRLSYDVVCANAGELPTGAAPIPWAFNLNLIPNDLGDLTDSAKILATLLPLNQCTGVSLPIGLRNGAMQRRLATLMRESAIDDEKFFVTNVGYSTYALSELVRAPDKLAGRNPFTTVGVAYGDAAIDAGIARIGADPLAAFEFGWYSNFRGEVGAAKVLSLHTTRDQLVVPGNQEFVRRVLPPAQVSSVFVAEDAPTHCGFTRAEGVAGWRELLAWRDGGAQPGVASLQARCLGLLAAGASGPCRFDAGAGVPAFDSQVRPRPAVATVPVDARYSGQWFDPARAGEGIALEVLPDRRALVYFFTYPPAGEVGTQAWMVGVGEVVGNGIAFEQVLRPRMRRGASGGEQLEMSSWGKLWLVFDDCGNGRMRWEGPANWGARDVDLRRLTALDGLACGSATSTPTQPSGAWSDPAFDGNGFVFERLDASRTAALWFGPGDVDGGQVWMSGVLDGNVATGIAGQTLYRTRGPRFGAAYDPSALVAVPGMRLDVSLGCERGTARYVATPPVAGSGQTLSLARITLPAGVAACSGN